MEEIRVELYGRVQAVGFRHFVRESADKLGLKGFVSNQENGSVFVLAQGSKEKLNELVLSLQKGYFPSSVLGMSYLFSECKEKFKDFKIKRDEGIVLDQKKSFSNLGKSFFGHLEVPGHVAVIPDGNRRWAKEKGLKEIEGHLKSGSYENLHSLLNEARNLGVQYFTLWGFSTENWNRGIAEKKNLFDLFLRVLKEFRKDVAKEKVRFRHLGRKDRLPKKLLNEILAIEEESKEYNDFNFQLCLDYGGKDEIVRTVNKILKLGKSEVDEHVFSSFLDSAGIPEPDLVIRTSGEKRLSGFMPFQTAYTEFYFADEYFPDFGPEQLRKAVKIYGMRKRNFGK